MGSLVAFKPSGKGLPLDLKSRSPSGHSPPIKSFCLGCSGHHSIPRYPKIWQRYHFIIKTIMDRMLISLSQTTNKYKSIPTTMKNDTAQGGKEIS